MMNHVHLINRSKELPSEGIMPDMKSYTSRQLRETIKDNPQESRREWLLCMFDRAGRKNSNNEHGQFWQQNIHPLELVVISFDIDQYVDCIHKNTVEASFVEVAEDYTYSSAKDYSGARG